MSVDKTRMFTGVQASPEPPPGPMGEAIRQKALDAVGELPEGVNGAVVAIVMEDARGTFTNLALIANINGALDIAGYVGKRWGAPHPEFGGQVRWTF